jgi:hypothetical protein
LQILWLGACFVKGRSVAVHDHPKFLQHLVSARAFMLHRPLFNVPNNAVRREQILIIFTV